MPNDEQLSTSSQESIACAIALISDDKANLIANLVDPSLFDPPFNDIVSRCLEHRQKYKRPPGKGHLDDVFAYVLENKQHKSYNQYHTILTKMARQADKLDTSFVLSEVSYFIRRRQLRASLAKGVERYQKGGPGDVEDIETIFRQSLKVDKQKDYGFSLADASATNFMDRDANDFCYLGIKELDRLGIVPTRREMFAFLSPPNRGKSWFLIQCGKMAMQKGWRVLHYTLENSDVLTSQRYFQSLFSGVKRNGTYRYTEFEEKDNIVKLRTENFTPEFVIENYDETIAFLNKRVKDWKLKLANLRIRQFPSGKLSFEMLEQDLEALRIVHDFVPDLLLVDMPQLMRLPKKDQSWASLDELVTSLRGLAVEQNLALVVPQQGNRSSNSAKNVQAQHGSGSFGVFGVADNLITYSQTASEEEHGLARLYTQKARSDQARMTLLISQNYASGQFCMDSRPMNSKLRDEVKTYIGYRNSESEDETDDEYEDGRKQSKGL